MSRPDRLVVILLLSLGVAPVARAWESAPSAPQGVIELPGEVLRDKIRGGLLGQILWNLNGLEHENAYIDEPGESWPTCGSGTAFTPTTGGRRGGS
jgi:hypothetical protein